MEAGHHPSQELTHSQLLVKNSVESSNVLDLTEGVDCMGERGNNSCGHGFDRAGAISSIYPWPARLAAQAVLPC